MNGALLLIYAAAFIISAVLTVATEKRLLPRLSLIAKQPIYTEGPSWHSTKSGTPTMGGLAPLIGCVTALSFCAIVLSLTGYALNATELAVTLIFLLANSAIGFFDDFTKLKRKINAGLTPLQKLILQTVACSLYLTARAILLGDDTTVNTVFADINLGLFYYPLALLLLLGIINCANLTDGVDGIASCVALAIGTAGFYLSAHTFPSAAISSCVLIGSSLGFLFFNIHPAKVFMGDTGSLFFGALAVSVAFSVKQPFIILLVGGVYVIEGASVILQVLHFKRTGKRIFIMAPLHHHLEKKNFSENKICIIAMITTLVLSLFSLFIFKI